MNNFPNQFHEALNKAVKPAPNGQAPLDQHLLMNNFPNLRSKKAVKPAPNGQAPLDHLLKPLR
ncbi:hypothetical protein [Companilactobacillus versmoldensis]|uniref:hypothetical protein n=1 Tax=Companilactobacillus versmoldensis TaxID=194326 RepID=UPI00024931FF|nr:hypothetical protein [Companilactobacillus versmoldensis]